MKPLDLFDKLRELGAALKAEDGAVVIVADQEIRERYSVEIQRNVAGLAAVIAEWSYASTRGVLDRERIVVPRALVDRYGSHGGDGHGRTDSR